MGITKNILFLFIVLPCNLWGQSTQHKKNKKAIITICTVNSECMHVLNKFASLETIKKLPDLEHALNRFFKLPSIKKGIDHYVIQPRYGGRKHHRSFAYIKETIAWIKLQGYEIKFIFGFGTAGANSKNLSLGDVIIQNEFEYKTISKKNYLPKSIHGKKIVFDNIDLSKMNKDLTYPVPYNNSPKIQIGKCITVNAFADIARKKKLGQYTCFQMNDYISAAAAKIFGLPFYSIRTISDLETIPLSFLKAKKAAGLWFAVDKNKKQAKTAYSDHDFYFEFRDYYLGLAVDSLENLMSYLLNLKK